MSRIPFAAVLTILCVVLCPPPAHASLWGWLEEFSGPGSFRVRSPFQNVHLQFACPYTDDFLLQYGALARSIGRPTAEGQREAPPPAASVFDLTGLSFYQLAGIKPFGTPFPPDRAVLDKTRDKGAELLVVKPTGVTDDEVEIRRQRKGCWFFDYTRYISAADENRGFPEIRAQGFDFGRTFLVVGPFDIAAAAGIIQFQPQEHRTIRRVTLTPLRFHVLPLWFLDSRGRWLKRLAYIPKLYVKHTAVLGTITGTEFGAPPPAIGEQEFRTDGELVTSYGVVLDLGEIIGAFVPERYRGPGRTR